MHTVFVAGSRAISKLNSPIRDRLDNIVKQDLKVLIGDANGVDKAVQIYLAQRKYKKVIVYCMDECRNNIGGWPTREHTVESGRRRDRHFYGIKDLAMAKDATHGFMLWDGVSKGTLTNVINLLRSEKPVLLYSALQKEFYTLRSLEELTHALNLIGVKNVGRLLESLGSNMVESGNLDFALRE